MAKNKKSISLQSRLDQIIRFHLYALIFLIPLFFWFDTQTIFTLPKLLALRFFSLSAGFFILVKFFFSQEIKFILPRRSIFLGFWTISLLLSSFFSLNQISSIFGQYGRFLGLITLVNLLLIPFYLANFFRQEDFKKLIDWSIFTAVLAAIYGLFQYFDFFGLWKLDFNWTDSPQNRVFGSMGHANHLGAYLSAHFLMLVYRLPHRFQSAGLAALKKIEQGKLIASLGALVLFASVILLTASRGAVLALVLAALVLLGIKSWKHWKKISKKSVRISAALISILLLIGSGIYLFSDQLEELSLIRRTESTIATINKGKVPERLSFLFSSWQMFLDHPVIGTGLSTFRDAYSAYRRTDYYIDGPGNIQYITVPESAHNEYINTLSTQGLIGFAAYLALLLAVLDLLIKMFKAAALEEENWYLVLLGGLLVELFQMFFNFGEIINLFLLYFLISIVLAQATTARPFHLKLPVWVVYPCTFLALVGLVLAFQPLVIHQAQADYYLKKAQIAKVNRQVERAEHYYKIATAALPLEYQLYQAYADFLLEASVRATDRIYKENFLKHAVQNYQQAILLNSNYPSTYHNLGLAYLELFRLTKKVPYANLSRQSYQRAIEKSPNNPRYLYEFARKLHSDWNDRVGAVKLLQQALKIAPEYQEPQDYLNFLYKNHPELASPLK